MFFACVLLRGNRPKFHPSFACSDVPSCIFCNRMGVVQNISTPEVEKICDAHISSHLDRNFDFVGCFSQARPSEQVISRAQKKIEVVASP